MWVLGDGGGGAGSSANAGRRAKFSNVERIALMSVDDARGIAKLSLLISGSSTGFGAGGATGRSLSLGSFAASDGLVSAGCSG